MVYFRYISANTLHKGDDDDNDDDDDNNNNKSGVVTNPSPHWYLQSLFE
jgi:hypothetical protein